MKLFRRKEIQKIKYYFLFIPLPWTIGFRLYFGFWPNATDITISKVVTKRLANLVKETQ